MVSDAVVKKALAVIGSSPANHQYFFERLESPEWIYPLRKAGRFKTPAQILVEAGGIRFPNWPESRYLSRMARLMPELVSDVITEAEHTDNERVHQDYVEAALQMPAAIAVGIGRLEARWIRSRDRLYTLYPEKVADLISHLANGGAIEAALDAARALLAITAPPRTGEPPDEPDDFVFPSEPTGRFDQWHYRGVLETSVPALTKAAPEHTLRLLADLLSTALRIHCAGNHTPDEDYSWIWRPRIEFESHQDVKDTIVSAVRDTALQCSTTPAATTSAVHLLLDRGWRVFRRVAAYVLDKAESTPLEAVAEVLKRRVEYEDFPGSSPEFDHLLSKSFDTLPMPDKEVIFSIIEAGPNLAPFKTRRENEGKPASTEDIAELTDLWRTKWLRQIEQFLPEEWKQRYTELIQRFGEPPLNDPLFRSGGTFVGPTSPRTEEELRGFTPDELINFLQSWQATGDWNRPSPEGLGRALSAMLSTEPERLAARADQLRGLDPTYVRSAIEGFREAIKGGKTISWQPVLALCEWIVSQPREIAGRKARPGDSDPDWGWARTATGRLMLEALQHDGNASIPIARREQVWTTINSLLDDPDPYEGGDETYGKGMFIGSLSLNTARGAAIEAAIEYGLWIRKQRRPPLPKEMGALSEMRELQAALEKHLLEDMSPAVREVYGRRFPWLVLLDVTWAAASADEIFQKREGDLGQIAWANYVMFNQPYDDVLPIMMKQYRHAVNTIGYAFRSENEDIDRHLAVHIMNLYWRGKVSLDDNEGILHLFFSKAPDKLRGHAIWSVGRGLYDEKGPLSPDTVDRLKRLWDWRFSETRNLKGDHESIQFGYWFASGKFNLDWSMTNLLEVLHIHHKAQPDHTVVERLETVADAEPLRSVQALGMIIEGDRDGWSIYGWQEHARRILAIALHAEAAAQEEARRVLNLLGSRGHYEYRDLLKKEQ